jgi:2'-5' RNA ligase
MTRGATARLFVALDLPGDLPTELAAWARRAAASARAVGGHLRLLEAGTLHVTLCFLGDRPGAEIAAIGEALAAACAAARPVGELALGAPLWLPSRRPRALAVELHDDAERSLRDLRDTVVQELAGVCDLELDGAPGVAPGRTHGRHFRPHVTVARMRLGDAPRERILPATPALAFRPLTLTLYRSWLAPSAASYEALASHALVTQGSI